MLDSGEDQVATLLFSLLHSYTNLIVALESQAKGTGSVLVKVKVEGKWKPVKFAKVLSVPDLAGICC